MPGDQLVELLTRGGAIGILSLIVWAFLKGWIVPGSTYLAVVSEKEEWKKLAVELLRTADRAVKLVEGPGT